VDAQVVASTVAPKFDMDLDMIYGADGKPLRLRECLRLENLARESLCS
jgi:hypothetical protein